MADDDEGVCTSDSHIKTRGRTRICKSCRFTCTDSKEFLNHQVYAHSQDGDPDLLASLGGRRKSQNSVNNQHTKKPLTRLSSSSDTAVSPSEKTNRSERYSSSSTEVTSPSEKTSQAGRTIETDDLVNIEIETSDSMSDIHKVGVDSRISANEHTVDAENNSDLEMDIDMEDKVNEQTYILNPEGEEQEEEGRLIIAEDEPKHSNHAITQPTRSGNIQNRTYVCNLCEFSSTSAKIFLHHQKDSHNLDITIYECDICEYATKYKQKLPRHRKLHFTGKENGGMMSGSDLDSSFGEKSFHTDDRDLEIREHLGDDDDEEEVYDEEEEEEEAALPVIADNNISEIVQGEKKKRKTRQEVDPAKYFEVLDETGVKYACSKCGNVYKWRKSLNKHWKEKHFGDLPDTSRPPPGLVKLNTISHVKYRVPSSFENNGRMSVSPSVGSHKGGRSNTATPQSLHGYPGHSEPQEEMPMPSASSVVMPKFIGPFITNTTSYPANKGPGHALVAALQGEKGRQSAHGSDGHRSSSGSRQTEQPLDFSVKKELDVNRNISEESYTNIKSEPQWNEYTDENGENTNMSNKMHLPVTIEKQESQPILQCSRCGFVAKTLVDYSSHMTLHLNKRAFKCAECQEHFNGVDDLNKHFAEEHSDKIHEHKEAIQKIPHGLQQTYHLLKMPLNAIGSMSTQEIGNGEPKFLKCSMCSFVAKWPAELQKHAVSHSEERPFVCMVCGSTYKWKWDLVKHFEKSHSTLPNPYKRREQGAGVPPVSGNSTKQGNGTSPTQSTSERSSETPNSISSLYEISSGQVLSSTTAALLDAGSHNIRKIPFTNLRDDIEPVKKKRRLSDTDLPLQNGQDDDSRDRYMGDMDDRSQERPSSEPLAGLNNKEDSQDAFMRKHLQLNSVKSNSTLKDIQDLIPSEDENLQDELYSKFGFNSPVSNETQKAMLEIMKKRLETGTPPDKNKLTMDKTGKVTPSDVLLPYRCPRCEYRARWPSEITQHMKNHSDEKPYHCPRCSYKSKWKWDVVKHLKRCGGGTIRDVIDTSKVKKMPPPNVTVMPQGNLQQQTPQPVNFIMNSPMEDSKEEEGLPNGVAKQAMAYYKNMDMSSQYEDYEDDFSQDDNSDLTNQQRQPVFRSLINQGMYHCLDCPFIGHSPAELRRHAVLHSENKPFTCTICGYSSRWKCDLKKHIRTYEHFDVNASNKHKQEYTTPMYLQDKFKLSKPSNILEQEDEDEEDRTLYKCDSCLYVTYKKSSYDIHIKMHGDSKKEEGGSSAKLRCKQCEYQATDLSSFLQHKKTHSATPQPSQPAEQVSNRTLHLKHRRKPVQQFKCSKCPYTCFKRSGLSLHEAMHEPRGGEAFICLYCDYNVYSKNLVLQHMRLHPEFDAKECQDFLKDDDTSDYNEDNTSRSKDDNEDCMVIDDMEQEDMEREYMEKFTSTSEKFFDKTTHSTQKETAVTSQSEGLDLSAGALDLSSVTQVSAANPQPSSIFGRGNTNNRFPCEWCQAMFPNVVTVYQHARSVHPFELRAQEMGESMTLPTKTPASNAMSAFSAKVEKPQNVFGSHSQPPQSSSVQAHPRAPTPQPHGPRQLHSQLFNQTFIQHPRYRPIEPKPHQQQQQQQQQKQQQQHHHHQQPQPNIQNIPKPTVPVTSNQSTLHQRLQEISNKVALSGTSSSSVTPTQPRSLPSSLPSTPSPQQLAQQQLLQQLKAKKSTSPHKRGRSFQCTKCSFTAPNAVTYLRHIERHGSNCRHTCRFCDYSIDRLNLLYQHMKGTHSDLWRGTPEEKINLTSNGSRQESRHKIYQNNDHSFDSNSIEGGMDEYSDMKGSGGDDSLNSSMTSADFNNMMTSREENKPVMVLKEETTWRGIPVQVCTINGRKNYKCPKCSYVSSNAANTTNHVRQHGSNRKYKCEQCDYSVDNLKLIYHHMQSVHPSEPNFLEKTGGKLPFTVEYEYLPEENNNSLPWGEEGFSNRNNRTDTVQLASCNKCPFKTNSMESIQHHQEQHEYNGPHNCQICDFSVDSQTELVKHLSVHRESYEPEILEDYEDEAESEEYNLYREHQKRQQQKAGNIESEMNMEAPTHKLTQQFLRNIVNRMKKNGERLRYKCSRCPYFSFCKNNIIKHRRQHLVKSQYACQMCDYSATRAFLLTQHMKFHKEEEEEMVKAQEGTPKSGGTFQDVVLDPFDKEGCNLLKNIEALDNKIAERTNLTQDEQKDFEDEALDEMEFGPQDENIEDFDEEEMAALERAEFEGINNPKMDSSVVKDDTVKEGQDLETMSNGSDDSLSEIDPSALQEQISLNMSATVTNGEKIRYNCSLCPYKCNALRSFKCHIHMHGLNKKYICDFCNWSADRLNLLYQHRKVHTDEQGFILNQEDIVFLNRDFALESNDKMSNNIMDFNFPPKKVNNNNNNNNAVPQDLEKNDPRRMFNRNFSGKKVYTCKLCPFTCNNKNTFDYHKNLHRIKARYQCSECSYSVDRWNLLSQHMQLHQGNDSFGRGQSRCPKCPYFNLNSQLMEVHLQLHGAGKEFACKFCDYSVDKQSNLLQHQKVHLTDESGCSSPLVKQMDMKNFEASSPDIIAPQLYFNSPENEIDSDNDSLDDTASDLKCDRCPYGTPSKDELADHEHQHNIHYKFTCPYCDYSCPEEYELVDHIQLHLPSTKVDRDFVKSILEKQSKSGDKSLERPEVPVVSFRKARETEVVGEPDSTTTSPPGQLGEKKMADDAEKMKAPKEKTRTKVYVCQYCEREFEGKNLMLQHERQHLIGSKY
ncbi:uncharacterized protein LOC117337419 [Pecten maximus]|uniref:uncharacterized protein LOC117337419 n=1 Tax=Pecten maximus TaxID=6579 RepID=UPI00145909BC|nr:uncharacterized protein LOC117337419 [Pecten maximus]XP_033754290.1 uncharacterized protein LOC117337419 [Pecten maximus]XP_033754291.1 uncharacterized protein LOC117337419 [Pecten maximus]XP_033754292.1 uncharacterized protein LOC117337419 [Pecten maximus]